jgi:hypothetical protein
MDILAIHFKAAANIKEKRVGKIQVVEIELVSEHLQQIACKLSEAVISILPEKD